MRVRVRGAVSIRVGDRVRIAYVRNNGPSEWTFKIADQNPVVSQQESGYGGDLGDPQKLQTNTRSIIIVHQCFKDDNESQWKSMKNWEI